MSICILYDWHYIFFFLIQIHVASLKITSMRCQEPSEIYFKISEYYVIEDFIVAKLFLAACNPFMESFHIKPTKKLPITT